MGNWKRARKPEQKAERIAKILRAATELFDEKELSDISMRLVAERAKLGKASLYYYFKTKEEVFLYLYQQEFEDWVDDVDTRLGRLRKPNSERVAKAFTKVLEKRERFCRLSAILSGVLERNLSEDAIVEFKASILEPTTKAVAALRKALPGMSSDSAFVFLYQHHAVVAGLWPLTHPSPAVDAILMKPEFQQFKLDFFSVANKTIQQLLET